MYTTIHYFFPHLQEFLLFIKELPTIVSWSLFLRQIRVFFSFKAEKYKWVGTNPLDNVHSSFNTTEVPAAATISLKTLRKFLCPRKMSLLLCL